MKPKPVRSELRKIMAREIRKSFGRFFAILAIIALGVGFFSGVRITTPAMVHTVDEYYRSMHFFDYKLVSTLGWEAQDVERFAAHDGVKSAEGSFTYDVVCPDKEGGEAVFRAHSVTKNLNLITLREGRMPQASDEALIEPRSGMGFEIGDTLVLSSGNDTDTLDHFKHKEYTIVGIGDSSLYINFERGTTSLGNGLVSAYFYIPPAGFDDEIYTEVYVELEGEEELYSDAYKDKMDELRPEWEDFTEVVAKERYDRVYDEAEQELSDARQEFKEEKADAKKELSDAEEELSDAKRELSEGERRLADANAELSDGEQKLTDAEKELADGKKKLIDGEKSLMDAEAELKKAAERIAENEGRLAEGKAALDAAARQKRGTGLSADSSFNEI